MSITGIKEILEFQLARLKTVSRLDKSEIIGNDDQMSGFRTYGAFLYFNPENDNYSAESLHIGNVLTETWTTNLDLWIKTPHKKSENKYTSSFGADYWMKAMRVLFLHQRNGGVFDDMYYDNLKILDVDNGIKITGLITTIVENTYPAC